MQVVNSDRNRSPRFVLSFKNRMRVEHCGLYFLSFTVFLGPRYRAPGWLPQGWGAPHRPHARTARRTRGTPSLPGTGSRRSHSLRQRGLRWTRLPRDYEPNQDDCRLSDHVSKGEVQFQFQCKWAIFTSGASLLHMRDVYLFKDVMPPEPLAWRVHILIVADVLTSL